jgi:hypothetical protein
VPAEVKVLPAKKPKVAKEPSATSITWQAYAEAYQARYGVPPIRNAKTNGQLANFCSRIPADEAPAVAAYYVEHNLAWYVRSGHSVDAMLRDAEKLRTEWATRRQITGAQAAQADRTQTNMGAFGALLAEAEVRQ